MFRWTVLSLEVNLTELMTWLKCYLFFSVFFLGLLLVFHCNYHSLGFCVLHLTCILICFFFIPFLSSRQMISSSPVLYFLPWSSLFFFFFCSVTLMKQIEIKNVICESWSSTRRQRLTKFLAGKHRIGKKENHTGKVLNCNKYSA